MTRTYGQWLGQDYILIAGKEYASISKVQDFKFSPWVDPDFLDGTDAFQFSPVISTDDILKVFDFDLSRNCYFKFKRVDDHFPQM